MLWGMFDVASSGLGITSPADLFAEVRVKEQEISRIRAGQVRLLRELMRPLSQPGLSVSDIASELDVSVETARALWETATRLG